MSTSYLSSGLTASDDDSVKCYKTEEIGANIQRKHDNVCVVEATIKRSEQVRSSDHLSPGIKVDKQKGQVNPTVYFPVW